MEWIQENWWTLLGYLASTMVGITFMMKTMIPLRRIAIASNVAFITYSFLGGLYPILILHSILLPLNIYRLYQMQKLVKDVKKASEGGYSFDWLVRYMKMEEFEAGNFLFKKGDAAEKIYYISEGLVTIPEFDVELGRGDVLGEMGIFSPTKTRTSSAETKTEVKAYTISKEKIMELYYQNPSFGFYIVELLTRRYIENLESTQKDNKNKEDNGSKKTEEKKPKAINAEKKKDDDEKKEDEKGESENKKDSKQVKPKIDQGSDEEKDNGIEESGKSQDAHENQKKELEDQNNGLIKEAYSKFVKRKAK